MTRKEILETAAACVCGQREEDYGSPEDNFETIAGLWKIYLKAKCISSSADVCVMAEDVAMMMALLKIARIASGRAKVDSFVDLAGYAACGGEIGTHFGKTAEKTCFGKPASNTDLHAYWDDYGAGVCCSNCGISLFHQDENNNAGIEPSRFLYCPYCGAEMDEEE